MNRKKLMIIGAVLIVLCVAVVLLQGRVYEAVIPLSRLGIGITEADADNMRVEINNGCVELVNRATGNGNLYLTFKAVKPGRDFFEIFRGEEHVFLNTLIVHPSMVITFETYFGRSGGTWILPIAVAVFLVLLLWVAVLEYREGMRETLYKYRNVRNLARIIYLVVLTATQLLAMFDTTALDMVIMKLMNSAALFSTLSFPVAILMSVFVTGSNILLMKKEGRNWRNMLGCFLGVLLCFLTVLPEIISNTFMRAEFAEFHNQRHPLAYIEMGFESMISVLVAYLECILTATIVLAIKAARFVPAFDKDYIMILGCRIRKDGTLTNLLKGRADRAIEFAEMQEKANGKKVIFVPSGGKGSDEVKSEAEAIRDYLVQTGIPEERILVENKSENTYQNFGFSVKLMKEDPAIAFSTTNYHVFRSGILAAKQGIKAEGIGSRTKSYFWINAFVREFVATLHYEWKSHTKVLAVMFAVVAVMAYMLYLTNVL
ncbi:MAG: YdcF family protein [Lachnospiraceae bacterium]|nr:YdcF family protein [Lachnospiraceae bacterium]